MEDRFKRVRKKPIIVHSFQLTEKVHKEICDEYFSRDNMRGGYCFIPELSIGDRLSYVNPQFEICISTLEGVMKARLNDWIIKGINGEFYPCKPDIFENTYENSELLESEVQGAN